MLQCEECAAISETGESWVAFVVSDEELLDLHAGAEFYAAQRQVVIYCPECAKREFG